MTKTKLGNLLDEDEPETAAVETAPAQKPITKLPPEEGPVIDDTPPLATVTEPKSDTQKIPDFRGKKARESDKLFSSVGISRKFLPPLTRRRSAVYQLCNVKSKIDNRLTDLDKYPDPFPYQLVPNYTFIDHHEPDLDKREKTMTYYEGGSEVVYSKDPVTGKNIPTSVPKIGAPEFIGGQKVVDIFAEYKRYVWWELHPRNASNKWRDKSKEPIFERVDTKYESSHVQAIKMDLQRDAETYVLGLKPDRLINLGAALSNPTVDITMPPQELRLSLRNRARNNPEETLFTAPETNGSIKIAVIHALDLGILMFIPDHESYYFGQDEDPMFRVPITTNPFDSLCKYFASEDGKEDYNLVKEQLSFWF